MRMDIASSGGGGRSTRWGRTRRGRGGTPEVLRARSLAYVGQVLRNYRVLVVFRLSGSQVGLPDVG